MAVSKLKALKGTVADAVDYITNPEKTEGETLVTSYGCGVKTATAEFELTAGSKWEKKERAGYHLIQSFSPEDEITPQKAHELGIEFAQKMLRGQYEFVIATHVDKGHIHNHIVFNSTNFVTHKRFHYNYWDKQRMYGYNDMICGREGLSVIERRTGIRGKTYHEYQTSKSGDSWKDKLKEKIDSVVLEAKDFEDFILKMELEGYEIKRGKYIAFRAPGQERFTRAKRLGEFYTEEILRQRIEDKDFKFKAKGQDEDKKQDEEKWQRREEKTEEKKRTGVKSVKPKAETKVIRLIVELDKCIKAQQSKGYAHAVELSNLTNLVKTLNYLQTHNIRTADQLMEQVAESDEMYLQSRESLKLIEEKMLDLSESIKLLGEYNRFKGLARKINEIPKSKFAQNHESEYAIYKVARSKLLGKGIDPDKAIVKKLFQEYKAMKDRKEVIGADYQKIKKDRKELDTIRKNIEITLHMKLGRTKENVNQKNTER